METHSDGWRELADIFVWVAVYRGVADPVFAIFSGTLWGPMAFVGGACVVASVLFASHFFEDEFDAIL